MQTLTDIMQPRCCLSCNHVLHGRSDKKFCNEHCRNAYNNQLNSAANNYMRNTDNQLRRNRRILQHALGKKRAATTHLNSLNRQGFTFSHYTHTHTGRKGNTYYFCYEFGYFLQGNGLVRIVQQAQRITLKAERVT